MLINLLKAFLIGICASAPLGPTAIFILQVSLGKGRRPGFLAGLGATTMDTVYAAVAVFALAIVSSFIESHTIMIMIAGGLIVALVGASALFLDPFRKMQPEKEAGYSLRDYLQAVALALSNPSAVFVMLTLFAFFGVDASVHDFRVAPIILAVSAGSVTYWFFFTLLFGSLRKSFKLRTLIWINRVGGTVIMIIGLALFAEGLLRALL